MQISALPNIMFSKNPFLIKRVFDLIDTTTSNDEIRKTMMNIKYWYASMPDECKVVFHTVISNDTFKIEYGVHAPKSIPFGGLHYYSETYSENSVNPHEARTYSEALEKVNLKSIRCKVNEEFSLIDQKNNFVFKVTTKTVSLIDEYGADIVLLNTNEKHALLIYGAIRGVQEVQKNLEEWETIRKQESLKSKILEVYNDFSQEKKT